VCWGRQEMPHLEEDMAANGAAGEEFNKGKLPPW